MLQGEERERVDFYKVVTRTEKLYKCLLQFSMRRFCCLDRFSYLFIYKLIAFQVIAMLPTVYAFLFEMFCWHSVGI